MPEDQVFALGLELARELARAHAESPPRHPSLDPEDVTMQGAQPKLEGGNAAGNSEGDIFRLGALLSALASGAEPHPSWALDGPAPPDVATIARRAALLSLVAPRPTARFRTALEVVAALERAVALPKAPAPHWPLFRGDPGRIGCRPAVAATRLEPVWQVHVGPVLGSPVVCDGLLLAPAADGRLIFFDPEQGRVLHELQAGSAIESTPAVFGTVAHVGTDDGELVGIDVVSGREVYRAKLGQLVRSSPLASGERVYVGVVEAKETGGLVALEAATGKLVWKRKLAAVFSSPALAGTRLLLGADDGSLHSIDAETGQVAWTHAAGAKVRATPAVDGGLAVVGTFSGRLTAVGAEDGAPRWSVETGHTIYSSAALGSGVAVVGRHDGHLHAVDSATGALRFEARTGGPVLSSPVRAGETTLAASTDGKLYLLDAGGAVLDTKLLAKGGIQSSPAVDGAMVYVGSALGVHALRLTP